MPKGEPSSELILLGRWSNNRVFELSNFTLILLVMFYIVALILPTQTVQLDLVSSVMFTKKTD